MEAFLGAWNSLERNGDPDSFSMVYRKIPAYSPRENPQGPIVREGLGYYLTPARCAIQLISTYPDEEWDKQDVERCQAIFESILCSCDHVEMQTDEEVEFGVDAHYPPGNFVRKRSKILQDLLSAPEIKVLCFDINKSDKGPSFTLRELLQSEEAFAVFQNFWGGQPRWVFGEEKENVVELEVKIPALTLR